MDKKRQKEVGKRLRNWRESKELSTVEIQYRTGIARSTLSSIEKGDNLPTLKTLAPLCELYGLSIDALLEFDD